MGRPRLTGGCALCFRLATSGCRGAADCDDGECARWIGGVTRARVSKRRRDDDVDRQRSEGEGRQRLARPLTGRRGAARHGAGDARKKAIGEEEGGCARLGRVGPELLGQGEERRARAEGESEEGAGWAGEGRKERSAAHCRELEIFGVFFI